MKKTLAILLALAMVFSTLTVAFAEGTIGADAQACVTLNMLKGEGNGVTADYLATAPTRLQAAILFLRLKGQEEAALAYTGTDNFADADQVAWAGGKAIMGYLKTHPELGWVGDQGKFDPNAPMTAQAYYKVMLETLGYKQNTATVIGDFVYENTITFAATAGLSKVATITNFTVNDVAIATVEALKANLKGGTKTLAASLVEAKVITEANAIAAGVYTAPVVTLAVDSVSATNLKEVVVKFNKAVDKDTAEDEANYTITVDPDNAATDKPIESATLAADGKTVTLVLTGSFANGDVFDLDVKDVEDTNAAVIEDTTLTATANDVTAPIAESVELTGPHTFEITFSEPVNVDGTVSVENDEYPVASAVTDGTNTVVVELSDSTLEAKDYKVEVSGYKDFALHKMPDKEFTLAYVKDTTAPTATITSVSQTEVKIKFSEKVFAGDPDGNQSLDENYFYHSLSTYHPYSATPSSDGKTYTLAFPDGNYPLPEGNVKVAVVFDANDEVVTDAWGNELTENIVLTANVNADTTKPTVTKVETDGQNKLKVYFSEDVNADDATDFSNYTVLNADAEEQTINDITYDNSDDEYVATIDFGGDLDADNYTIKVEGIYDLALEANKMAAATVSFEVSDEVGPTVPTTSYAVDGTTADTIYVDFGEDMASTGAYSALDKNNYQINGNDLAAADTVSFFNGDKSIVKITIADETDYVVTGAGVTVSVARLADAAGNKMDALSDTTTTTGEPTPSITRVSVLDAKTVEIRVNAHIKDTTPASAFEVTANGHTDVLSGIKSITWDATHGYTKVVGILKANEQVTKTGDYYNTGIGATDYSVAVATDIHSVALAKTIYGTEVSTTPCNVTVDKFAPTLETIENSTIDTIKLTFTEVLGFMNSGDNDLAATDLVIKDKDGDRLVPTVDYTVLASGDTLTVSLANDYAGYDGRLSVATASEVTYLGDVDNLALAGLTPPVVTQNAIVAFSKSVTMDTTAPFIRSVAKGSANNKIVVTFNEAMDETQAETVGNYSFSGGSVSSAALDSTGKIVTLTLSTDAVDADSLVITDANLIDVVGNALNVDDSSTVPVEHSVTYTLNVDGTTYTWSK